MPADHGYFSRLIRQIADLLRGPCRPAQYERAMLPMTGLRRFDRVLAPTRARVLTEYERLRRKGGRFTGELDSLLNRDAGQRFHNRSPRDFEKIPLAADVGDWFEREVRPHVPDAWMDRSRDRAGCEINFNRRFYEYTPPRPLEEIDADLKKAEEEIVRPLRVVAG